LLSLVGRTKYFICLVDALEFFLGIFAQSAEVLRDFVRVVLLL